MSGHNCVSPPRVVVMTTKSEPQRRKNEDPLDAVIRLVALRPGINARTLREALRIQRVRAADVINFAVRHQLIARHTAPSGLRGRPAFTHHPA